MTTFNSASGSVARLGKSKYLAAKYFQYACAASGIGCLVLFLCGLASAGFLPPIRPSLTAEQTTKHYRDHKTGVKVAVIFLMLSGMFYLPFTAVISGQIRRIPNLHSSVHSLQLAAGAAGIFTFLIPPMILAVITYRLDRNPEITQVLSDLFFIIALIPWPTFLIQNFAFSYAVLVDHREKPIFPKYIALVNVVSPVLFVPGISMHFVKSGPLAWNGGVSFWMAAVAFGIQVCIDSLSLMRCITIESQENATENELSTREL
ncbi:hypothetical protein HYALB_00003834 [Hymenoscyphus albidus]|uniref:Integral membrane protein n=1 Tax=Hymenoscyphus albidus TaxID=595503 RepID=A0A9N9LZ31_9HELO|nr:hypothetical protein HYALB_00003834 [Hymenoscyphus albidus]